MALWTALLKPLRAARDVVDLARAEGRAVAKTSASRSKFVPTSSLFFKPIQALAGDSDTTLLTVTVKVQLSVPKSFVAVAVTVVVPTGRGSRKRANR